MSSNRHLLVVALVLVVALGSAQAILRGGGEPPPRELVGWERYTALTEPPWDGPVLLEFSADWCVPCRRLQVTVFREPAFVQLLDTHGLRPVRLHYESTDSLEWLALTRRMGVEGLPAMVILAPDGRHAAPIDGVRTIDKYDEMFGKALAGLDNALYFHDPQSLPQSDTRRATLRVFDTWWYMDRSKRTDWSANPAGEFSSWVGNHIDLVDDDFGREFPLGFEYYSRYRINTVPTMVLEDWRGVELGRFEGQRAIEEAPGQIARIAREAGLEIPDPPTPHAQLEKPRP